MNNQRNKIYDLFDFSLLMYLICFFSFYQDEGMNGRLRLVASILLLFSGALVGLKRFGHINYFTAWYFILIIFGIMSIAWAKESTLVTSLLLTLFRVLFISIFLCYRINNKNDVEKMLWLYVISGLVLDIVIAIKMLDFYSIELFFKRRFGDNFAYNSNTTAVVNAFSVIIVLHKIKIAKFKKAKAISALIFVANAFIIMLTASKRGLLAFLFGVFFLFLLRTEGIKRLNRIFIGVLVLFFLFELMLNIPALYQMVGYRFDNAISIVSGSNAENLNDIEDLSTENRGDLYSFGIELWMAHPIIGVGLNNFAAYQTVYSGDFYYAHNNYIELLADLGIIGAFFYYLLPIGILFKRSNNRDDMTLLMKTVVIAILFGDFGGVTYQDIRIQLLLCLAYITTFGITHNDDATMAIEGNES